MIEKQYFVRQAAILFGIAKATKDPKISAALMDKAADIKSKVDELGAPADIAEALAIHHIALDRTASLLA